MSNGIFHPMIPFIGMVEDRADPMMLGRCRVRIVGYHTEDKTILPTDELPWALPIQPITSAAISGIGSAPVGPVEGTWVVGWFLDGPDMQQPVFFGTIGGVSSASNTFSQTPEKANVNNPNDGVVKDSNGDPVLDSNGNEVRFATPSVDGWSLGQTSEKYESGGRGPGVINAYTNSGDYGGASYGCYQFASYLPTKMPSGKSRPSAVNSPCVQYAKASRFSSMFAGLTPATPEFDAKWKAVAASNTKEFKDDQHEYIKKNYYDVMMASLARSGLDLSKFGPGVQDLVWSTSVQFGPGKTSIFTVPLRNKSELTDTDIITLVSEYKINNVDSLFASSSPSIKEGVRSRFKQEKNDLLKLVKA